MKVMGRRKLIRLTQIKQPIKMIEAQNINKFRTPLKPNYVQTANSQICNHNQQDQTLFACLAGRAEFNPWMNSTQTLAQMVSYLVHSNKILRPSSNLVGVKKCRWKSLLEKKLDNGKLQIEIGLMCQPIEPLQ